MTSKILFVNIIIMDEKAKKDFILLINQGFEEVIAPRIEELKEEIKTGFEAVKKNSNQIIKRQTYSEDTLEDHEKRLRKLESKRILA